jgi:hypothetical protein
VYHDSAVGIEQRPEERDADERRLEVEHAEDREFDDEAERRRDERREHGHVHVRQRLEGGDADGGGPAVDDGGREWREAERDEPDGETGDDLVGAELDADHREQAREQRAGDDTAEQPQPDAAGDVRRPDARERGDDEQALEADVDDAALLREDATERGERDGDG